MSLSLIEVFFWLNKKFERENYTHAGESLGKLDKEKIKK